VSDVDRFRTESRKGWGSVAGGWEQHAPAMRDAFMPVTAWMLDAVGLQPGTRLLELAGGTGEVGLLAHELIQPGGELILSDFAPEMLSAAQRQAEARGVRDIRFKQIDMESIDLEAGSQDAVLCRFGLMFLVDPETALHEIRRVLRPGGRFATAAWTAAAENPWSSVVEATLVGLGHAEPSPPGMPGQFAFAPEGLLYDLIARAGFVDDVRVEALDFVLPERFDSWWARTVEMSRAGQVIRGLSADERATVEDTLRGRLAAYEDADGVLQLPARTWVAAAAA
jgi:SAM-dependent methyltransferase